MEKTDINKLMLVESLGGEYSRLMIAMERACYCGADKIINCLIINAVSFTEDSGQHRVASGHPTFWEFVLKNSESVPILDSL